MSILMMMYKTPAANHPDFPSIHILTEIILNTPGSKMEMILKKQKKIIMDAGGFVYDLRKPGYALYYLIPFSEDLLDIVKNEFDVVLDDIVKNGVTDDELKITKKDVVKSDIMSRKDVNQVADDIALGYLYYGDPQFNNKMIERYRSVTNEDIKRVARKYFVKENRTTAYIVPQKDGDKK